MKKNAQLLQDYICCGDIEGVRVLIKNHPSLVNFYGGDNSPLILAADCGNREIVDLLLEAGADVNYCNATGETALSAACFNGDINIVKLFLEKGADEKHVDRFGVSVIDNAIDHPELIALLREYRSQGK